MEFDTYWQNGGYKKISDIIFAECHIFIVSNLCSGNEIGMAENGGEARSSFIEKLKGILYTVSQFLSSLKQYILYVCVGKHMCYLLI